LKERGGGPRPWPSTRVSLYNACPALVETFFFCGTMPEFSMSDVKQSWRSRTPDAKISIEVNCGRLCSNNIEG
jgi:hypothetical protein